MKTLILTFIAILGITTIASAQKSERLTLGQSQQKTVAGRITVKFVAVLEDSRCPEGVNCIWAGVARIKIQLRKPGKPAREFELNTNQLDKSIIFEGREIKLTTLSPYPKSGTPTKPAAYTAILTISKS